MGREVGKPSQSNGPVAKVRDFEVAVSYKWTRSAYKNLVELLRFRLLMIRLEVSHPDVFKVVKELHRGIDTHELGLYDGNKFDKPHNESTSS